MAITVLYRSGYDNNGFPLVNAQEFKEFGLGWETSDAGYLTISRQDNENPHYPDPVGLFAPGVWLFVREQE
jgi:hypothetical protein